MIDLWGILIAIGLMALGCAIIVYAACRLGAQMDARRRRWEAMRFEHDQQQQRVRMHSVAVEDGSCEPRLPGYHESGSAEADLAAFMGLLVCMGLILVAVYAASGW